MSASIRSMSLTVCRSARAFSPAIRLFSVGSRLRAENSPAEGEVGIIESTAEYKFVERLIPPTRIPTPPKHDGAAPSGWIPPSDSPPSLPYMIRRSRMHNVPVYSDIKHGSQHSTLLRKVEGDIWALNKDVKEFLLGLTGRELPTQVNEVTGIIRIKGQFEKELKDWLVKKGF
ncbi:39S ribosomal protein L49, mitochondrial-like [Xyrauchen texanus]|uniref:39S ribosomal protein L49, mitochondrial-like n=1 Tax=Xyrauchen texanus TaxID=154827 RepID=UPI002241E01F|nr:39S ribosomal protein L49, mitochondrial-like [Xyrauchen texanus]